MRTRLLGVLTYAVVLMLLVAPAAEAYNDGRGFYGATNDKAITNIFFGVIAFFPVFVFVMSMLQKRLDRRKEARLAAHRAQQGGDARWRGGW
ncbi:MAG TPA: hypothetical protein VGD00_02540 [Solirubrobacteraceae bacterium]|jgi:hypothetical protein